MAKRVKRVFYFKRFIAFVCVLCVVGCTVILLLGIERRVKLGYGKESFYVLTSITPYDSLEQADSEVKNQLVLGNLCVSLLYGNSIFVCYEAYSSYANASDALKAYRNSGKILSILYVNFDGFSVTVKKEELENFKRLYALAGQSFDRTAKVLDEYEKNRMSSALCQIELNRIKSDFLEMSLQITITDDENLLKLHEIYKIFKDEIDFYDKNYDLFKINKQLHFLKLLFSVKYMQLVKYNFH